MNKLSKLFCLFLFVINIICIYSYYIYKSETEIYFDSIKHYIPDYADLKYNLDYHIKNKQIQIDNITIVDTLSNRINIDNLFDNEDKEILICRLSDKYCMDCNIYMVNILKNVCPDIIYLTNKTKRSDIRNIKDTYKLTNNIFGYDSDINIDAENKMFPYIFSINKNLQVTMVYFPQKGCWDLDCEIIRYIKEYIDKNNIQ